MKLNLIKNCLIAFILLISSTFAANSSSPAHPHPAKTFKIFMVLWSGEDALSKGFMDYLKRQNIAAEYTIRNCNQDRKQCHELVKEIRKAKPDLIFTWGTPVCEEIAGKIDAPNKQDYIWDIPIVSLIVTNPVAAKLIYSLKNPGRNVTGVNHVAPVTSHIEAMKTYFKGLKKIAALYNPAESNSCLMVAEIIKLSKRYNLETKAYPVQLDENKKPIVASIEKTIKQIAQDGADFIYMPADTFLSVNMPIVSALTTKYKIPTFGSTESMFFNGHPLMGVLSRFYNVGLFGGLKAAQILLQHQKPEEIAYEKLKTFSVLIAPDIFRAIEKYPPLEMFSYAELIKEPKDEVKHAKTTKPVIL